MLLSVISCASDATTFKGIDLENPVIEVTPFPLAGYTFSWFQRRLLCERVRVAGKSRLKLGSYANAYQVTVAPSAVIPEKLHKKIQICFHQNASRGLCQCEKDEWRAVENWIWSSVMSPYEDRYVDLKFVGEFSGSMTVTVEEEFRRWRLFCFIAVGTSCHWLGSILLQQFNGYWSFACHYYPSFSGAKPNLVIEPNSENPGGLTAYLAEKALVEHFKNTTIAGNVIGSATLPTWFSNIPSADKFCTKNSFQKMQGQANSVLQRNAAHLVTVGTGESLDMLGKDCLQTQENFGMWMNSSRQILQDQYTIQFWNILTTHNLSTSPMMDFLQSSVPGCLV